MTTQQKNKWVYNDLVEEIMKEYKPPLCFHVSSKHSCLILSVINYGNNCIRLSIEFKVGGDSTIIRTHAVYICTQENSHDLTFCIYSDQIKIDEMISDNKDLSLFGKRFIDEIISCINERFTKNVDLYSHSIPWTSISELDPDPDQELMEFGSKRSNDIYHLNGYTKIEYMGVASHVGSIIVIGHELTANMCGFIFNVTYHNYPYEGDISVDSLVYDANTNRAALLVSPKGASSNVLLFHQNKHYGSKFKHQQLTIVSANIVRRLLKDSPL